MTRSNDNTCWRCLGPLMGNDLAPTINHDRFYGHFGRKLCQMTVQEHNTVVRLQLEGGRV